MPRPSVVVPAALQAVVRKAATQRNGSPELGPQSESTAPNPLRGLGAASTASEAEGREDSDTFGDMLPRGMHHGIAGHSPRSGSDRMGKDSVSVTASVRHALKHSQPHPKRALLGVGASIDGSLSSDGESVGGSDAHSLSGQRRRNPKLSQLQLANGGSGAAPAKHAFDSTKSGLG